MLWNVPFISYILKEISNDFLFSTNMMFNHLQAMRLRFPKASLIFFLSCCVAVFCAETIYAVRNGQITAEATTTCPEFWHEKDGAVVGSRMRNLLMLRQPFVGENLVIDAELALERLEGTAASLIIGNGNLGLDGGNDHRPFFEMLGGPGIPLTTDFALKDGEFFQLHAECANGRLVATADGQPLADVPFVQGKGVTIALRPQRSVMKVRSFRVTGTPMAVNDTLIAERLFQRLNTIPVALEIVSARDGGTITVKSAALPTPGDYQCIIMPDEKSDNSLQFQSELDDLGQLRIPVEIAQAAYAASGLAFKLRPMILTLLDESGAELVKNVVLLMNPEAWADFPQGEVRMTADQPEFWVNNEPLGSISGRVDLSYTPKIVGRATREFAEAGIHDHLCLVFPYHFMRMDGKELVIDWKNFLADLEHSMICILAEDPLARFHFHWELLVSPDWADAFPEEALKMDNGAQTLNYGPGKKLQPSYASPTWRRQVGAILAEAVRRLRNSPYADRISHWRLLYANCGEWNHWGYHEGAFVDYSMPMQRAFGKWLKAKYTTAEALQAAWGRADVDFLSDDLVPSREDRFAGGAVFRTGGTAVQSTVDYYDFFQEYAVRTIEHFARIVKEESDGRLLVGSYYGYYWGHLNNTPYHQQDSGNYGMKYLLESPWLDFVGGPYPYEYRRIGLETNGLALSLARHGKVWESEGDMRTHYCGEGEREYGTTDSEAEDISIARRDWLLNRSRKASYYFFDFAGDWYRDLGFVANLERLHELGEAIRGIPDRHPARVAFVVSEESLPHFSNQNARAFQELKNAVFFGNWCCGMPYDILGEADLKDTDFSQYQFVVFANAAYASDETIRLTHERVMKDNRTVLFLHAPGLVGPDNLLHPERSKALTEIGLRAEPQAAFSEVRFQPGNSPYMSGAPIQFQTFIDDSEAEVMATYPDGQPAGAIKHFADYTSAVLCHPGPNPAFMRTLLSRMGIHIYERENTYNQYFFTGPLVGIYSREKSKSTLAFPQTYEVIADVFSGEVLGRDTDHVTIETPDEPATTILFTGTVAEWERVKPLPRQHN